MLRTGTTLGLVIAVLTAGPAAAGWSDCSPTLKEATRPDFRAIAPETVIPACSAIIESGSAGEEALKAAYLARGLAFDKLGDLERAVDDYRAVRRGDGWANLAVNRIAGIFGEVDKRRRAFNEQRKTERAKALRNADWGDCLRTPFSRLRPEKIVPACSKIADENIGRPEDLSTAYFHRGRVYDKLGWREFALDDYKTAIALNPELPQRNIRSEIFTEAHEAYKRAIAHIQRGKYHYDKGEFEFAVGEYDQAVKANRRLAEGYMGRGLSQEKIDDLKRARNDFRMAIRMEQFLAGGGNWAEDLLARLKPTEEKIRAIDDGIAWQGCQQTPMASLDADSTIKACKAIIDARRASPAELADAHLRRGRAYSKENRSADALRDYDKAIELNPDLADAHTNRGGILIGREKYDEAIAALDRAIGIDPDHAIAHANRGVAHKDKGNLDKAISDYRRSIALNPDLVNNYHNLANVLEKMGDLRAARESLAQAAALETGDRCRPIDDRVKIEWWRAQTEAGTGPHCGDTEKAGSLPEQHCPDQGAAEPERDHCRRSQAPDRRNGAGDCPADRQRPAGIGHPGRPG